MINWLILRFEKLPLNSGGIGHRRRSTRGSSHSFRLGGDFCYNNCFLRGVGFYREGVLECCIGRILSPNREVLLVSFKPIVIRELVLTDPRRTKKWIIGKKPSNRQHGSCGIDTKGDDKTCTRNKSRRKILSYHINRNCQESQLCAT